MANKKNKNQASSEDDDHEEDSDVAEEEDDEDQEEGEDESGEEDEEDDEDEEEEDGSEAEVKDEEGDDDNNSNNDVKEEEQEEEKNGADVKMEAEDIPQSLNGKRKASEQLSSVAPQKYLKTTQVSSSDVARAIHLMDQQGANNNDDEDEGDMKWRYLEHHGVLFPDYWKEHNVKAKYDGKPFELNLLQEEMATYWAQTLGSDWETKKSYKDNFSRQFLETFNTKTQKTKLNFDLFDFSAIKLHLEEQRELKKGRSKEDKKADKTRNEQLAKYYAGAILDGFREKVGQFMIEPPTLFKGRGEHPKMGLMKGRIQPEAVVINISKDAPVPKCGVPGHAWSEIVHKQDVTWLASYKDSSVRAQHKYIFLAAESRLKAENDKKKYEKARRLKKVIDQIRSSYEKKLVSSSQMDRQLGTATYLIDKLALRVGNEKSEEEADTVGCCSLRVEHIKILDKCQIGFDFLGKDSMRYQNTVTVTQPVWNNMEQFRKNKKETDDLFNQIDASTLNEYLKSLMDGLTAKVFRTFNASYTLQKELDKSGPANLGSKDLKDKMSFYDEANRNVAILCNHQKTVGKNFDVMVGKMEQRINVYRQYETELNSHLAKCKKNGSVSATEKEVILEEKEDGKHKMFTKKFPGTRDKILEQIEKNRKKIEEEESKKTTKEKNKEVALGTSKTNYNDPRISVNWCKKWEVPIEKVFQKTLIAKFVWAMETDLDWSF